MQLDPPRRHAWIAAPTRDLPPAPVAESPVALECRLEHALELGDSTVVLGRVVHAVVDISFTGDPPRG
ncbi:MAG: flavin reductase [Pseudonocardia sp.]